MDAVFSRDSFPAAERLTLGAPVALGDDVAQTLSMTTLDPATRRAVTRLAADLYEAESIRA